MINYQIWFIASLLIHEIFDSEYYFWKARYDMSLFLEENPQLLSIFDVRTLQNNHLIIDLHNFITIPSLVLGNSRREINDSASVLQRNYNDVYHIEDNKNELIESEHKLQNQKPSKNLDKNINQRNSSLIENSSYANTKLKQENSFVSKSSINGENVQNPKGIKACKNINNEYNTNSEGLRSITFNEKSNKLTFPNLKETKKQLEEDQNIDNERNFQKSVKFNKNESFNEAKGRDNNDEEDKKEPISQKKQSNFNYPPNYTLAQIDHQQNETSKKNKERINENPDIVINKKRNKNSVEILTDLFTQFIKENNAIKRISDRNNALDNQNDDEDEEEEEEEEDVLLDNDEEDDDEDLF